jgi:hypothetical protein
MSRQPCSNCRSTTNGPLKYWYLAGFDGETRLSYRLRFCRECVEGLLADVLAVADRQDESGRWLPPEAY